MYKSRFRLDAVPINRKQMGLRTLKRKNQWRNWGIKGNSIKLLDERALTWNTTRLQMLQRSVWCNKEFSVNLKLADRPGFLRRQPPLRGIQRWIAWLIDWFSYLSIFISRSTNQCLFVLVFTWALRLVYMTVCFLALYKGCSSFLQIHQWLQI